MIDKRNRCFKSSAAGLSGHASVKNEDLTFARRNLERSHELISVRFAKIPQP